MAIPKVVTLPGHMLDMAVTCLNNVVLFRFVPFRPDTRSHTITRPLT